MRRSICLMVALVTASIAGSAHAGSYEQRMARQRKMQQTEDAERRKQALDQEHDRQRQDEDKRRETLLRRGNPKSAEAKTPFVRASHENRMWGGERAYQPSVVTTTNSIYTRTHSQPVSLVAQLSHGITGVSSMHAMLLRHAPAMAQHFDFVHQLHSDGEGFDSFHRRAIFSALR